MVFNKEVKVAPSLLVDDWSLNLSYPTTCHQSTCLQNVPSTCCWILETFTDLFFFYAHVPACEKIFLLDQKHNISTQLGFIHAWRTNTTKATSFLRDENKDTTYIDVSYSKHLQLSPNDLQRWCGPAYYVCSSAEAQLPRMSINFFTYRGMNLSTMSS